LKRLLSALVFLTGLAVAVPASFATPITGQFSVTGSSVQNTGTQLVFNPNAVNVGAANTLTGDFSTILTPGEAGTITSPINYTAYVPGTVSMVFSNGADSVTFILDSVSVTNLANFAIFTGSGTVSTTMAGYDPTFANIYFSTQGNGVVTFSATTESTGQPVSPVPEPSTLMMLGTGLVGAAGMLKRRLA
jgi:hypothetical protein